MRRTPLHLLLATRAPDTAVLESAGARLVVSEPKVLGLDRGRVQARAPGVLRCDIDLEFQA